MLMSDTGATSTVTPFGECGLKYPRYHTFRLPHRHSLRGVWVEICPPYEHRYYALRHSLRGVWVEIQYENLIPECAEKSLPSGSVG